MNNLKKTLASGALLLCLGLAGCGVQHRRVDPGLAAWISPDAVALVGVHVDHLRDTPLYRTLIHNGLDPGMFQNVHELLLASDGKNTLILSRGALGDFTTMLDKDIGLTGSAEAVRAAKERYQSGRRTGSSALLARAESLPAGADIWAVALGGTGLSPDVLRQYPNAANVNRIMQSVEEATLTISLDTGLHAAAVGTCRNDQDANNLAESLGALLALARLALPKNQPDLTKALDAVQVKQDGRLVKLNIELPQALVEKLPFRNPIPLPDQH